MNCKISAVFILAAISLHAYADAVRSIDKDGNITFSDQPTPGSVESERIGIDAPALSQDRLTESQREAREVINRANSSQQLRDNASQIETMQTTSDSHSLDRARKQLEATKVIGEGDRIGKAGGGTRLSPEHLERVKQAEQAVKDAE